MPKNTNELNIEKNINISSAKSSTKSKKSSSSAKVSTSKKSSSKNTVSSKKVPTKAKASNKSNLDKVSSAKKTSSKKISKVKKNTAKTKQKKADIIEYYDLPYRYGQTIVRILAQTPTTLFVYWDISDDDREKYIDKYGKDFFEKTVPILIVHNKTMNYSFEIEINDFANSWYFNVNDANCNYEIELGRRAKTNIFDLPNNYMYVTSSNIIEAPNNHILFEKNQNTLFFRNVKTNKKFSKNFSHFDFMHYAGKIYNIYDVYKKIYKEDELKDLENNPTSTF